MSDLHDERKQSLDQAEAILRAKGHKRAELLEMSPDDICALAGEYGVLLDDPRYDGPKLTARVRQWHQDRVMKPR